jgi:YlmC/YmxH family sporulation protein
MQRCSTDSFQEKEVVNVSDGRKLGYVTDLEFCVEDGRITALIVGGECGIFGLGHSEEILIPWCNIKRIGEDVILVEAEGCLPCPERKKKKKR